MHEDARNTLQSSPKANEGGENENMFFAIKNLSYRSAGSNQRRFPKLHLDIKKLICIFSSA